MGQLYGGLESISLRLMVEVRFRFFSPFMVELRVSSCIAVFFRVNCFRVCGGVCVRVCVAVCVSDGVHSSSTSAVVP